MNKVLGSRNTLFLMKLSPKTARFLFQSSQIDTFPKVSLKRWLPIINKIHFEWCQCTKIAMTYLLLFGDFFFSEVEINITLPNCI